ncbi:hypothetical protein Cal6303_2461 [Calothrix sp. PCC 6303]|nr:hypothetical protein Cal6303_2461 [Calothrix sp. PCC 6303]
MNATLIKYQAIVGWVERSVTQHLREFACFLAYCSLGFLRLTELY